MAFAFDLQAGEAASLEDAKTLDAVVVSATKRSDKIEDINGSVTVVEAEQLQQAQVRDTGSLDRVLPGVQIGYGSSQLFPIISLRGGTSSQDFYNPTLTFYIDGVPQMPVLAMQALVDVDRVELLRGPQGTLFGKSAQGGVVNIVTRQPDDKPFLWVDMGTASYGGYHAKASAGGALIKGNLYGSATLLTQSQPGYLRNPSTGTDNLGGARGLAGAMRLRYAPEGASWEVNFNASGECTRAHQDAYVIFDNYRQDVLWSGGDALDPMLRRCSNSESLSGSYRFGDWTLTAMTAWQRLHYAYSYLWGSYENWQPERWRQNVQEVRLATNGALRHWDVVFGLYRQAVAQQRTSRFSEYVVGANDSTGPFRHGRSHLDTLAAYADGTLHLTPRFDIGAGARVSQDKASTQFSQTPGLQGVAGELPIFSGQGRVRRSHVLGQLSAGYRLGSHWNVYARVAQGYKPAGFNLAPTSLYDAKPFGAEDLISYEMGMRFAQSDVALRAAVFRNETRNMQMYTGIPGYQIITNAGKAQSNGAEFYVDWSFLPGWTVAADGTVAAARFNRFDYSHDTHYTGQRVPFVPRYNAGLHVQGELATTAGSLYPGMDVRWVGTQSFDLAGRLVQPAYSSVDMRLGWRPTRQLLVTAYALNVADQRWRTFAMDSGMGPEVTMVNLGRIIGVDVHIDWF